MKFIDSFLVSMEYQQVCFNGIKKLIIEIFFFGGGGGGLGPLAPWFWQVCVSKTQAEYVKYCFISSFINIACQKSEGGGALAPWCRRAYTAGKGVFYYILLYILKLNSTFTEGMWLGR